MTRRLAGEEDRPMPNRRHFLQAAAAASVTPALAGAAGAGGVTTAAPPVSLVIYDERFAAAREFGRASLALGARVRRIAGDVTDLWNGELYPMWRQAPAAIAGMTARDALFCLEQIGWDFGMRLRVRNAHLADADGAQAAHALLTAPLPAGPAPAMLTMSANAADEFGTLYRWVLAPVQSGAPARSAQA